jgi:simple sugar transport system permease protein
LQAAQLIPSQFVAMIPYLLTIVAVAGVVGRSTPPAALGKAE